MTDRCQFSSTSRSGLYIMVFCIMLNTCQRPGDGKRLNDELFDKICAATGLCAVVEADDDE